MEDDNYTKDILRNLIYLTNNITNLELILIHLLERKIISMAEYEMINSQSTHLTKNHKLLSLLQRGYRSWSSIRPLFLEILRDTYNAHCADKIEEISFHSSKTKILDTIWWPEKKNLPRAFLQRKSGHRLICEKLKEMFFKKHYAMTEAKQTIVISGFGEVGKTSAAIWYALMYDVDYDHIIWMDCGENSLSSSIRSLARDIDLKYRSELDLKQLAYGSYKALKDLKCLFIFDNAKRYNGDEGIKDYIPKSIDDFHVIITSRHREWNDAYGEIPQFEMEGFEPIEGIEFMKINLQVVYELKEVETLCNLLGNRPSALQNAVLILNQKKFLNIQDYIESINAQTQSDIKIKESLIARGGYGIVYMEEYSDGTMRARKDIMLMGLTEHQKAKALREVRNWLKLKSHDNVVKLHYHVVSEQTQWLKIYMEYFPDGDLHNWLNDASLRNAADGKDIFRCIIAGLIHIHSNELIHRDIKPHNILLNKIGDQYIAKIGDFGLSTDSSSLLSRTQDVGTSFYQSPEQQLMKRYSYPTDIFSAGIVLFEISYAPSGNRTDSGKTDPLYLAKIQDLSLRQQFPKDMNVTDDEMKLILTMVDEEKKRPNAQSVMEKIIEYWFGK